LMGAMAGAETAAALRNRRKSGYGQPTSFWKGIKDAAPGAALGAGLGLLLDRYGPQALGGLGLSTPPDGSRGLGLTYTKKF
jgi:hypothetical protein